MAFKMKGMKSFGEGTPLFQKKGKNYEKSKGDQQGPVPEKNIKLQKGELDGTSVYSGPSVNERITSSEERAGYLTDNDITNDGSKEDNQRKKAAKNLNREAQIMRDRRKNTSKKK